MPRHDRKWLARRRVSFDNRAVKLVQPQGQCPASRRIAALREALARFGYERAILLVPPLEVAFTKAATWMS